MGQYTYTTTERPRALAFESGFASLYSQNTLFEVYNQLF
jgi:hypothetical protein